MRAEARAFDLARLRRQWRADDARDRARNRSCARRTIAPQRERSRCRRRRLARRQRLVARVGDPDAASIGGAQ
jgi:hypothetical protein